MLKQRGFTLIELMIVVAIIAILAAIAISQYQDYVGKAQVTEAFSIADGLKTKVSEAYNQSGACPQSGIGGIPKATSMSGKYVLKSTTAGTATSDGGCTLEVQFKAQSVSSGLTNKTITFTLIGVQSGPARWECTSIVSPKYLPQTCR